MKFLINTSLENKYRIIRTTYWKRRKTGRQREKEREISLNSDLQIAK